MESVSKLRYDPLMSNTISTLPSGLLSKHLHSTFMELLRFSSFILVTSIEAFFILKKRKPIFHVFFLICFILFFIVKHFLSKASSVYLVDFSCLRPPSFCRVPFSSFLENASMLECFDVESISFMAKVLSSSGLSEETYLPPALHYIPPKPHVEEAIKEVHMVLFPILEDLLSKTRLLPHDIDILIVNCSGFCPSPSLSSIIINKYSMRSDIKSYTLSGMGCSASTIAVDMALSLLKIHKNSCAVVLSTEILSTGWYPGNEMPKLLLNCMFRMGSAAILLSNKSEAKKCSKYKLYRTLRTQTASDDKAYFSAVREEDSKGNLGFTLNKGVQQAVGEVLRSNVTFLGSSILPFKEKFRVFVSILRKIFIDKSRHETYVPSFKTVIQHFCLPTAGKATIREIAKGLKLEDKDIEPALMTLERFGNQSSSALWYELALLEAKDRVKKGDMVWLLGLGSGLKCSSVVLECIRPIVGESKRGPWADYLCRYPIVTVDQGL
ncbi:3-ketoacyl-CoA synthase 5-like [Juglans microcarpa x Juglans regia]|uniref:3-ketoacyl-CoA synthase 5-like n=1 Tax=Juglans microcarpa x Juglans regia TaxID=2249226 RepID=UPI001B7DBD6C|nr:3-ketoacyl-CoA synthase 5-like [Juglans microcarpa x Juglans regia]